MLYLASLSYLFSKVSTLEHQHQQVVNLNRQQIPFQPYNRASLKISLSSRRHNVFIRLASDVGISLFLYRQGINGFQLITVCQGRRGEGQNLQLSERAKQEVPVFSCL